MSDDLIERLRTQWKDVEPPRALELMTEAADRIEELEAALREMLRVHPESHAGHHAKFIARLVMGDNDE